VTAVPAASRAQLAWRELIGRDTRFVLLHFLLSRLVFLAGGVMTAGLLVGSDHATVTTLLATEEFQERLRLLVFTGDSNWYQQIVADGYRDIPFSAERQQNWAFFPLYPMLVRAGGGSLLWGVLLSNLLAFAAVRLLAHEVRQTHSRRGAEWTVLFLLYWPASGWLSAYRPEALLLLSGVLVWAFARRGHWWLAWLAVAMATGARAQGLATVLLMLEPIWAQRQQLRRSPWALILGAVFPLIALGLFSWHLGDLTGDALAWLHIQETWGRTGIAPVAVVETYRSLPFVTAEGWDFALLNLITAFVVAVATVLLLAARRYGFALYSVAWTLAPALLGPTLISLSRYAAVAFPVFVGLGTSRWLRRLRLPLLLVFAALLFGYGAWLSLEIRAVRP
jgi:hypothetical protein